MPSEDCRPNAQGGNRGKIVIAANSAWFLANFRSGLIAGLAAQGFEMIAVANPDPAAEAKLTALGCRFRPVSIDSKGISPLNDARTLAQFVRVFREERPACFLSSTIKPNIFGGYAARLTGTPFIADVTGLGTVFIRETWVTRAVVLLYRLGLSRAATIFFHNSEDLAIFRQRRLVTADQAKLIAGAGVDVAHYAPWPETEEGRAGTRFLMVARMLRDKGVHEYVDAARQLRADDPSLTFHMLGFVDVENRTAVGRAKIAEWEAAGDIEFLGTPPDVRPHIAAADCVVLPSYREGTAVSLLEAAAMGKPIVATDVPGCREVVDEGVTGLLCRPRDSRSLADAMRRMAGLGPARRAEMGVAGRAKILREYDQRLVIERYLAAIETAIGAN